MKKKTILFTTIAGTMLIAGLSMTNVKAANVGPKAKLAVNTPDKGVNGLIVELMDNSLQLTEDQVRAIVAEKYKGSNVSVSNISPVSANGTVGTGAIVTLNTGKQLTVILYGDTTGDGQINVKDAQALMDYKYNVITLSSAQLAAANVLERGSAGDTPDAQRIFEYQWASSHDGFEGTDYAEGFDKITEILPTTIDLDVTKASSNSQADDANTSKISEVVLDGNTVKLKINNTNWKEDPKQIFSSDVDVKSIASDIKETGKWYRVNLDTGLATNKVSVEGAILDASGNLWLNANQGAEIPVTITNLDDPTEVMKLTVKLVNASEAEFWTARKVANPTGNTTEVSEVTPGGNFKTTPTNEINVKAYVGAMVDETINGVSGRWFEIELITDMPASQLKAVAYDWTTALPEKFTYEYKLEGSDTPLAETDSYYVSNVADAYNADSPRYAVKLYANGLVNSTDGQKILVYNKEALSSDLTSTSSNTAKRCLTVKVENTGSLNPAVYVAGNATNYGTFDTADKPLLNNQQAITVSNNKSQNTIEVTAELNKMKKFNINNNKVVEKTTGVGVDETGHKYFALLLNLGTLGVDEASIEGLTTYTKATAELTGDNSFANSSNTADTDKSHTILIWLDAEDTYPKTFTITGGTASGHTENKSKMTMTINLTNIGSPEVNTVAVATSENSKAVTATEDDHTANTINVNARLNGMTESKRIDPLTGKEVEGKWFALRIRTTVARELLGLDVSTRGAEEKIANNLLSADDMSAGYTDLANDEIVLWVNAEDTSLSTGKNYIIKNKNNGNKNVTIKVKLTDVSTLKLGNLSAITETTVKNVAVKNTLGISDEQQAILAANAKVSSVETGTTPNYKVQVNVNSLAEFTHPTLGNGKWVPFALALDTDAGIRDTIVEENGIDKSHLDAFELTTGKSVLVWVDVAKLVDKEKVTFTVKSSDATGVTEVQEYTIELNDVSTFKDTKSTPTAEKGFTLTDEFIKAPEHKVYGEDGHFKNMLKDDAAKYLVNQALVKDVVTKREGNTIKVTVTGNFAEMYDLTNNNGVKGKIVTLKLDLGIEFDTNNYFYRVANGDEDITQKQYKNIATDRASYGCSTTEDYWNESLPIILPQISGDTGVVAKTTLEYSKGTSKDAVNGDTLKFVIEYVQDNTFKIDKQSKLAEFTNKLN